MYSDYITPDKRYHLKVEPFICNQFGLAEFFAEHYNGFKTMEGIHALDVGCGALPLGIFLADQHKCKVTGVELNPAACRCAGENIRNLGLEDSVELVSGSFADFSEQYEGERFDLIVSNPPVDDRIAGGDIEKYADHTFETLDDASFSYLTNSWHSANGKDLLDYIFEFGRKNLKPEGRIMIVFCTIDCSSPDYVYKKAENYGYETSGAADGSVSAESIGAESLGMDQVYTCMVEFRRRWDADIREKCTCK